MASKKNIISEQGTGKIVFRALALGSVAGLRSLLAPALLSSKMARKHPDSAAGKLSVALSEPPVAMTLKALSAGELIGNKLPEHTLPHRAPAACRPRSVRRARGRGRVSGQRAVLPGSGRCWARRRQSGAAYGGYHLRKHGR